MDFGGGFLGAMVDLASMIPENMYMEEDRNQRQQFDASQNEASQKRLFDFQERMSNTAYQRAVADMKAAGVNPMLSAHVGGASTPGGAAPGVSSGSGRGPSNPRAGATLVSGMTTAATVSNIEAQTRKIEAETQETLERTKNYPVTREQIAQQIAQSKQEVERIMADTNRLNQEERTSASHMFVNYQSISNMRAEIPRIEALVRNLNSSSAFMQAQTSEVKQRVAANLPEMERALQEVQHHLQRLQVPGKSMDAAVGSSYIGAVSALLKALNPLQGLITIMR